MAGDMAGDVVSARLTPEQKQLRSITEAQWRATVIDLAKRYGWKYYVAPNAGVRAKGTVQHVVAGWPDITLVRGWRLLFIELKAETGTVTDAQQEWHEALTETDAEVYVLRPSDLQRLIELLT